MKNNRSIINTEKLEDIVKTAASDKVLINDVMTAMDAGGFGLVMLVFSLPIIIPLPPPLPSLISIPLIIFSLQMVIGFKYPRLPKFLSRRSIKRVILANLLEKSSIYLRKAEKLLKPRMLFLSQGVFERIIGFFILIFSLSILLPIPLTNFLPGIGVLITALGLISKDGIIIVLGISTGILGLMMTAVTIVLGVEVINIIKDSILSLFYSSPKSGF